MSGYGSVWAGCHCLLSHCLARGLRRLLARHAGLLDVSPVMRARHAVVMGAAFLFVAWLCTARQGRGMRLHSPPIIPLLRRQQALRRVLAATSALGNAACFGQQVKLLKCLVDNIVVDISFDTLNGLCTLAFLEVVDRHVGRAHLFKRSIILARHQGDTCLCTVHADFQLSVVVRDGLAGPPAVRRMLLGVRGHGTASTDGSCVHLHDSLTRQSLCMRGVMRSPGVVFVLVRGACCLLKSCVCLPLTRAPCAGQVKAWCYYESRLLGAHHGLISTYALETMVLYIFNLYHTQLHSPLRVRGPLPEAGVVCGAAVCLLCAARRSSSSLSGRSALSSAVPDVQSMQHECHHAQ